MEHKKYLKEEEDDFLKYIFKFTPPKNAVFYIGGRKNVVPGHYIPLVVAL